MIELHHGLQKTEGNSTFLLPTTACPAVPAYLPALGCARGASLSALTILEVQ